MREPADLEGVSGLILPGGESTTMRQLIDRWGLHEPILDLAETGAPLFGTCAGMIVLASEIAGGESPILPLLDITVERNAFGRQLDSFEAELTVPILGDTPVHAVFIRAPIVDRTGPDVDVLARLDDGRVVAVRRAEHHRDRLPPGAGRRDPLPPPDRDDGRRARRPGRGLRPPAAPDPPGEAGPMSEAPDPARRWQGPPRAPDRPRRPRRAVPPVPVRRRRHALARTAAQRAADRRVQPVPPAARRVPAERPDVRLRAGWPDRRARPRRARVGPRRVDDRGA